MSEIGHVLLHWLSVAGIFLAWTACVLLGLGGLVLSVFSISGTWLVFGAALGAALLTGPEAFPGWPALLGMLAVCAAVDILEWFAANWGVRSRGGSAAAGWMALLGSLAGAILGGMVFPVIGSLIGMLFGSFTLVFLVEKRRLQKADRAAHIATGAVLAGISVLLLKVVTTAGLVVWLAAGILL